MFVPSYKIEARFILFVLRRSVVAHKFHAVEYSSLLESICSFFPCKWNNLIKIRSCSHCVLLIMSPRGVQPVCQMMQVSIYICSNNTTEHVCNKPFNLIKSKCPSIVIYYHSSSIKIANDFKQFFIQKIDIIVNNFQYNSNANEFFSIPDFPIQSTLKKIILVKSGSALKSESIYQQKCFISLGG